MDFAQVILSPMQLTLLPQSFASNPLDRSAELSRRKEPRFLVDILQGAEFAVIKGNSICVRQAQHTAISWFSTEQLEDDAGFVKHGGVFSDGGGEIASLNCRPETAEEAVCPKS